MTQETMATGVAALLAGCALWAGHAAAQVGPANAEDVDATAIVVTAQKRTERLQDVPLSIAVQSGTNIEAYALDSIEALQRQIPNLSITDTPANNSPTISTARAPSRVTPCPTAWRTGAATGCRTRPNGPPTST